MHTITVASEERPISVEAGVDLLKALRLAGIEVASDCGGSGSCNKCLIRIRKGWVEPRSQDVKHLERWEIEEGYRFACGAQVQSDLVLELPGQGHLHDPKILSDGVRCVALDTYQPIVTQIFVTLPKPKITDSVDDLQRLAAALKSSGAIQDECLTARSTTLIRLSEALRENDFSVTATIANNELLDVASEDRCGSALGMAFDIGTTTVVGYLLDLKSGNELAVASRRNPQASVGYNVLARAEYAGQSTKQLNELQEVIASCLQELTKECVQAAGVNISDCFEVAVCGNTIMTHLLFGVPPTNISVAPFVPVWTEAKTCPAREVGLQLHPEARVYALPGVAGYVGGDITAGLLATGVPFDDDLTLFIDIGTNGEMVLGNRSGWTACASPAGPAFEGARISCGISAGEGAIDQVRFDQDLGDLSFHLIGQPIGDAADHSDSKIRPQGICGTGLIDAVAVFLETGMVEPAGRVLDPELANEQLPPALARRIEPGRENEHGPRILLIPAEQTAGRRKALYLTQRDIRELQLAKGAIRAGADTVLRASGYKACDVKRVYIAGGFGNYIRPESAKLIGLLPDGIEEQQIKFMGNTAGVGTKLCLLDKEARNKVEQIARETRYVELSAELGFSATFMDAMIFPGEEEDESKPAGSVKGAASVTKQN